MNDASDDTEQVRAWWAERPDANVGIATGVPSGLLVIVIDPLKGEESYAKLQQELPSDTFTQLLKVRTGSGGSYLYFRHPGGLVPSQANIRPGVDIEADGGYVVAPPSLDVNGVRARFSTNSGLLLPALPKALYDLVQPDGQATSRKIEGLTNSLDAESPPKTDAESKSVLVASSHGQIEKHRDKDQAEPTGATKSDRGSAASHGATKPRLLVEHCDPDRTVRALCKILAATGELFDRGAPVRLVSDPQRGTVAKVITADALVMIAHEACRPYMLKAKRDGSHLEDHVRLPKSFATMYLDYGAWGLAPLNGITTAPLLQDDGAIRSVAGYDAHSGLWCENVHDLTGRVPERPTLAALSKIRNAFGTFPFADAEMTVADAAVRVPMVDLTKPPGRDESSFIAAALTAVCRPSLYLAPGVLLRAPAISGAGAGKGLLARCISIIAYGREPHAVNAGPNAEELEKRISAELVEGNAVLFLDNLNDRALKSEALASAITERPARTRILGKSQMVSLNSSTLVILTGNGLSVSEDLARRFIIVELDPRTEDPEARSFTTMIRAEVTARRTELLAALLTIWRWGRITIDIKAGRPLGSFEQWCRWVRDPLLALGCLDPAERVSELKERDPMRQEVADLYALWHSKHAHQPVAAASLDRDVRNLIDPQGRGRQFVASRLEKLVGTRAAGFVLTRQKSAGKWGHATYALGKTP